MARVICTAYGASVWRGVEFREETVGGARVGVAHDVTDPELLRWFGSRPQFIVDAASSVPAAPEAAQPAPDLSSLTVAQLREYASENGIDLGTATRKADILAALS